MWSLLLEKEPRFLPIRNSFLAEWEAEGEPSPEFICISELVIFTIAAFARGENWAVQRILDVVEKWLVVGDEEVSDLAFFGFIEDLTNGNLHKETSPEDVEPLLSPVLKAAWTNMINAWSR